MWKVVRPLKTQLSRPSCLDLVVQRKSERCGPICSHRSALFHPQRPDVGSLPMEMYKMPCTLSTGSSVTDQNGYVAAGWCLMAQYKDNFYISQNVQNKVTKPNSMCQETQNTVPLTLLNFSVSLCNSKLTIFADINENYPLSNKSSRPTRILFLVSSHYHNSS